MDEYQSQLAAVEQSLSTTIDEDERVSLLSLRADLLELLDLTRQTIGLGENVSAKEGPADTMDNEMHKFMNEIEQLERSAEEDVERQNKNGSENDVETELVELQKQLESMVGQKCSAPHEHTWGSVAYHNAIICGIGNTDLEAEGTAAVCLRVLFTNPTHREMLPCSYFLEGECRFDANNCHYSHGELVHFGELREYTEPDFEKLERNCVVLAKMQDRLWHKGRVLCSNFVEKICRVRLDENKHKEKEMDFAFENLFPIFHDEDLSSDSSSDSDTDTEENDELETGRATELENNLFTFSANQPLGEWEKHTRGIGSKLMAKMGYVHGTGLGWNGKGIITPISAQVLPQGCSLDHCMNLREAANGDKDLFSVEMKLKRDKKKQDNINAKAYERETQRVDVFSFLNGTILNNSNTQNAAATKTSLQSKSTKSLNVESVRIADDIRKKTREIAKVEESMQRNATGTEVHKRLQLQLDAKTQELNTLKKAEHSLAKEQTTRKTREKLCVF